LTRSRFRKLIVIALPATIGALVIAALATEVFVRLAWDESRGTPGFFVSDPARGQRLAANYTGWFAGVPAQTNALGFRDSRNYSLEKARNTFRILVLGDSVTFGHGAPFETTYPYLLEQRLRSWRPDVNWEVWNLGVPGYNTAQELAHLQEVGPLYRPDLVVVGFFPNDFTGVEPTPNPGVIRRALSATLGTMQRHVYSTELYKRLYLTARWQLFESVPDRRRLEHLESEDVLLQPSHALTAPEHTLNEPERLSDEAVRSFVCEGIGPHDPGPETLAADIRNRAAYLEPWFRAVAGFQQLHREGKYRIVFFANMAPFVCGGADRFTDQGTVADSDAVIGILGAGTPAVSSLPEFMHYRPSQMPAAAGHSLGNSNLVKAKVLFEYLRDTVLPALVPPILANP
jgi:hypothetical protein